ncbi:hypothetical protein AUSSIE_2 [Sinorhizobium phage Aussie]|nr:hypothetical protein AUSSIE_2 [Sinorhizobium phage Aussie]
MRIIRFSGKKLNGYLDLDISFRNDLTFVTGINGTGKTTALNSIVSLLMPRLDFLTLQNYETISIDIENEGVRNTLSAHRTPNGAILEASGASLELFAMEADDSANTARNRELEQGFYREQLARQSSSPVLSFIQSLPTPMFLGLDRRALSLDENVHRYARPIYYNRSRRRNLFSQSLSQGLSEALTFAFESYRSAQRSKELLDARFRQDLVLDLIDFTPANLPTELERPAPDEAERIQKAKRNLQRLPALLNVSKESVSEKIDPLFNFLESTLSKLKALKKNKKSPSPSDDEFANLFEWSFNKSHLNKISSISDRISTYNQRVDTLFGETTAFLKAINGFVADSGKEIKFDDFGELVFSVAGEPETRDLRALSSGEIQLIVILAHLHFNPEVQRASIFIIDEPELSLHVEWQEKFVDTMLASGKSTQLIMATHSPSIILDRVKNCIDLTPRAK